MNLQSTTRAAVALASVVITMTLFQSVATMGHPNHAGQGAVSAQKAAVSVGAAR